MAAPPDIRRVLEKSCYDCHSHETEWPWYSYVAPASWLVVADVREARTRMNFSNWPQGVPPEVDCFFRRRIAERAGNGEMPPFRYRLLHPSAEVAEEDVQLLRLWSMEPCTELD